MGGKTERESFKYGLVGLKTARSPRTTRKFEALCGSDWRQLYFILYGYMVYVLSISNVRGQAQCRGIGHCGSTECPQYDHRGQNYRRTLQICDAGEGTRPGDPCLFNLA